VRASALSVGLGVGRALITSGSCTRPSYSCDGWVCDLGVVGAPLIFGLTRGAGAFDGRLLTFPLVSGFSGRAKLLCHMPLLQSSVSFKT
jgi:hypothetical protein